MTEIDLSALEADLGSAPKKGANSKKCAVQTLVAEHPEAEKVLRDAIGDLSRSSARVATILTRNGLKISETTISRHRRGGCDQCRKASA